MQNKEELKKKVLMRAKDLEKQMNENGLYHQRLADMMLGQFKEGH